MSSLSSFTGAFSTCNMMNKNTNNITVTSPKMYLCPKCNNWFDVALRNNVFVGRVPLVLKCNHTVCEDCVRRSLNINRTVVCVDCLEEFKIDANNNSKIQEIFPVNFYLLGIIYYSKPYMNEVSNLSVKPVGVKYKDRSKLDPHYSESDNFNYQLPDMNVVDEPCSQERCSRLSTLSCLECNEVFCDNCCETLHGRARGLQSHNITQTCLKLASELSTKCPIHKDFVLEFQCITCDNKSLLCCYCIVLNHKSHQFKRLSDVEESQREQFGDLIQKAEEKMKKLMVAHKRVTKALSIVKTTNQVSPIEIKIIKFFSNVHAQLQQEETKWLQEIASAKNYDSVVLDQINNDVFTKIRSLNGLIKTAKSLEDPEPTIKVNVTVLTERLEDALKGPCYFVGEANNSQNVQFQFDDELVDLTGKFSIEVEPNCGYRLVMEDEIGEDYETEINDEISSINLDESLNKSTSSKNSDSCSQSDILLKPLMGAVQKSVEGWVQQTCEEKFVRPNLKKGNREKVIVSHIDNPDSFYVQLARCDRVLRNFSNKINLYVRNMAPMVARPELNGLYIVKYQIKNGGGDWYRARVVDVSKKEEDLYMVMFIDYGNTQAVKLNMLREINGELARPRPFALHCKLYNVYPKNQQWEPKAVLLMVQIINGEIRSQVETQFVQTRVTSSDIVLVVMDDSTATLEVDVLSNVGGEEMASLRDALIFIGHAVPSLDATGPITKLTMKSVVPVNKIHKRTLKLTKGQVLQVLISHVIDPHLIYVQVADFVHHVEHLSDAMNNFYYNKPNKGSSTNKTNNPSVYVPKPNMLVAVQQNRGASLKWYRAIVTDILHGRGLVEIFLIDYGNTMTVSYEQIKKLPETFRRLDSQAVLVKMVDVEPSGNEWGTDVNECLNKYVNNKDKIRLVVAEASDIPNVVLFDSCASFDVCINALIVNEGFAVSTGKLSEKVEWMKEEKPTKKSDDCYALSLMKTIQGTRKDTDDNEEEEEEDSDADNDVPRKIVNVLSSKSPAVIYVSFDDEDFKKLQLQLHYNLQSFYYEKQKTLPNPEVGVICAAFNSNKGQYFRAIILEKIDDNNFNVILRDIAEEICVSRDELFVLDAQFKQYCEGAIRCHLAGIIPAGDINKWSGLSIEYLNDIFKTTNTIYLSKSGLVDKERKSLPVVMWYAEFKPGGALEPAKTVLHNINKLLINKGLALKDRQFNCLLETAPMNSRSSKQEEPSSKNKEGETFNLNMASGIKSPELKKEEESNVTRKKSQSLDLSTKISSSSSQEQLSASRSSPPDVSKDWNSLIEEESSPVDWLPPLPFSQKKFEAIVTNVDDGGNIYLHDAELASPLHEMEAEIQKMFCDIPPEPVGSIWMPGQLCTVKYHLTEQWHRGKILTVNDGDIRVYMIDYGNIEDCTHEDLRFKVMYLNIEAFANRVHLYNIPPEHKWLTSDLDELHKMLVDNKVTVFLKGKNIQNISVAATIYLDGVNVNKAVVKFNNDAVCVENKQPTNHDDDDVVIEGEQLLGEDFAVVKDVSIISSPLKFPEFNQNVLSSSFKGKKKNVGIISIIAFNKFILEIVSSKTIEETKNLFEKVTEEMKECAHEQPMIDDVQIGQACVALFSEDNNFYRGKVMDKCNEGYVSIWFVDFGNFEDVPLECIRDIKPEWLEMPIYQHRAELHGIDLVDPTAMPEVFDRMSQLCDTVQIAKFISIDPLIVSLYDNDDELCYQNLIDENMLTFQCT